MISKTIQILGMLVLSINVHTQGAVPEPPSPQANKFAIELFKIESAAPFEQEKFVKNKISIPELFKQGKNQIEAYPVLYCAMDTVAICDQTETVQMPENFNVKDGKAVPIETPVVLGMLTQVTVTSLKNNIATYQLDFSFNELKGYDEYVLKGDIKVKLPFFETRKINTELSQSLGSWLVLGGFSDDGEDGIHSTYYVIRITRPLGMSRSSF